MFSSTTCLGVSSICDVHSSLSGGIKKTHSININSRHKIIKRRKYVILVVINKDSEFLEREVGMNDAV
jgi:hypothetical protein